jgi:hypothetical protein
MAPLSYEELLDKLKKGMRRGNWWKLNRRERGLYLAAMAYTKPKKKGEKVRDILSRMVVEKLLAIIEKLMETRGMRIFKRGFERAVDLLVKGEKNGMFVWYPRLKDWLKDPDYIFWLGTVR